MGIDAISSPLSAMSLPKISEPGAMLAPTAPNEQISAQGTEGNSKTFGQLLQDAIGEVNQAQGKAADLTGRFAAGESVDIHQVEIAGQEANVMLSLTMQVRNKLMDAYTEVMHVNV